MPRLLPLAGLLLACAACNKTDSAAPKAAAEPDKLVVGSAAPPITGPKWVRGNPVNPAEPGKVTVLEFWMTWCEPCLDAMPHLSALAAKHQAAGLQVAAVTTTDKDNPTAAVEKYLAGRGKDVAVSFAVCDTPDTARAYLMSIDQEGYPASLVIDRAGKVAFIGRPFDLDEVLPKVLAGTWKGEEDVKAMAAAEAELNAILGKVDEAAKLAQYGGAQAVGPAIRKAAGEAVPALDAYAAKYPARAARPLQMLSRAQILMHAGKWDAARTAAAAALDAGAERKHTGLLVQLVGAWADRNSNPEKVSPELPVKAADELLKIAGPDDVSALVVAAQAYLFAGEKAKGRAFGQQALDKLGNPQQQGALRQRLQSFEW